MALVQKTEENSPVLYDFYGQQYDYNDLAKDADAGLNAYLDTLKRGNKDSQQFREAYGNIMNGIQDGSITFSNGQFHDAKGRYTNSDKKNSDYYGLMANYIYNKMGKSGLYEEPEETPWDGSTEIKNALMQELYNSDSPNTQDFLDLDTEKDGVRGVTNRAKVLANAFQSLADNFDTRFQGASDTDKTKYLSLLGNAANALRDGTIDPGDYLALSKAVGGVDFRGMLDTGTPKTTETTSSNNPTDSNTESDPDKTPEVKDNGVDWSKYKFKNTNLNDGSYNSDTITNMTKIMSRYQTSDLVNILRNSCYNRKYRFGLDPRVYSVFNTTNISSKAGINATLNALNAQGKLKELSPHIYYIPMLKTKQGAAWIWDSQNNTLTEKKFDEIQGLPSKKKGGILYAGDGASFNNIYASSGDIGYDTYLNKIYNNKSMLDWVDSTYNSNNALSDYSDFVKKNVNQRYRYGINDFKNESVYSGSDDVLNFNRGYQNNGITPNYILFGNSADDYNNRQNGIVYNMGVNWSRPEHPKNTGDSWNADASKAYIDNAKGLQTYSRVASLTNKDLKSGQFGDWGDLWASKGATGAYYYTADGDSNKYGQWIPTADTTQIGYIPFKSTTVPNNDPSKATAITGTGTGTGTGIGLRKPSNNPSLWDQIKNYNKDELAAFAGNLARLNLSLNTNNKNADILKNSIHPVLKDPYELYSPVTGSFSQMQFLNNQAAQVQRKAATPITSDASLQTAMQLDSNKQAQELEQKGFIADDTEIKRTQKEALNRQEHNLQNRTEVANYNNAALAKAEQEIAQIEAQRNSANYQGINEFLSKDVIAPIQEDINFQKSIDRYMQQNKIQNNTSLNIQPLLKTQSYNETLIDRIYLIKQKQLQEKYQDIIQKAKTEHASDISYDITNDPKLKPYYDELQKLELQKIKDKYQMSVAFDQQKINWYNNIYNNVGNTNKKVDPFTYGFSPDVQQQSWYQLLNNSIPSETVPKYKLKKASTKYLINKVVK